MRSEEAHRKPTMRPAEKMAKEATAPASGDVFFQCFISRVRKSMIAFTRCALLRRILVSDTLLAYKSRKLCDSRCVSLYSTPCHVDTSVKSTCLSSIHSIAFMPTREISELSAGSRASFFPSLGFRKCIGRIFIIFSSKSFSSCSLLIFSWSCRSASWAAFLLASACSL